MSESRKRADWPIVAAIVLALLVASGAYIGGYFAASESRTLTSQPLMINGALMAEVQIVRVFKLSWLRTVYWPAAKIEAVIHGYDLHDFGEAGYEFTP